MKDFLNSPNKVFLLVLPIFLIGMFLGSFGYTKYVLSSSSQKKQEIVTNSPLPEIIEEVRPTTKDAKIYNFLLTGHGGGGHSGGGLMDAIIVVSVNITDKKAGLISVPRDFWFSGHKINADPSLKDAVAGVTGLSIPNQISIDFASFIKMIDTLNGVDVDVKKVYTDNFYPVKGLENELCGFTAEKVADLHSKYSGFELEKQFTCRYETISYSIGLNHMIGADALKYVRSRHGDGDFGRSRRQYEVLKAILQKANVKSVANAFDFVETNLTLDKVNEILTDIGNPLDYSVSYLGLTDENVLVSSKSSGGAYILVPREGQDIKTYIKNNL
ncbi:MAG TPA: LCP family protein [Patescibacteria group bacterium]|nr:LCP family protein [Patescibacteria group bacterium]